MAASFSNAISISKLIIRGERAKLAVIFQITRRAIIYYIWAESLYALILIIMATTTTTIIIKRTLVIIIK